MKLGGGRHILWLTIAVLSVSASGSLGVGPADAVQPCPEAPLDTSFAAGALTGAIAPGESDCHPISNVSSGDWVSVGAIVPNTALGQPRWRIVDGQDNLVCGNLLSSTQVPCQLSGVAGWSLIVYDYDDTGTFSYALAARRLNEPQGCGSLGAPKDWSFTAARSNGSIGGDLDARCFTFTRAAGEADGTYWFRTVRTSGAVQPRWTVYGPSGTQECSGSTEGIQNYCKLLAAGQFTFVVADSGGNNSGTYYSSARRLNPPSGCGALPSVAFGASPTGGSIAVAGEADCYSMPGVSSGDNLSIGFRATGIANASPRWTVIDGDGSFVCGASSSTVSPCELSGAGGWSLVVYDEAGAGTFSYALAARRLNEPQGCGSLGAPKDWSFTAARSNGSIGGDLDARCFTFTRAAGEADGRYWLRTVRTAGDLEAEWNLYGPSGTRECTGGRNDPYESCNLLAAGQFTFVVADSGDDDAGSFYVTARRLNAPSGCDSMPSLAFGAVPMTGSIATAGEAACLALPDVSSGDAVSIGLHASGASNASPRWMVVDGGGGAICSSSSSASPCELSGAGGWSLIVYDDAGTGTFSYSVAAWRLTDPEGCTSLGAPKDWSFTAGRTNGVVGGALSPQCFVFSRALGEADGAYWFRAVRTSGTLQPRWTVFGPSGSRECSGANSDVGESCRLLAPGAFTFVVEDSGGEGLGSYYATARRLTAPDGCAAVSSAAFGVPETIGNLSAAGEADCYSLPVSDGDRLKFNLSGSSDRVAVIDSNGTTQCTGVNVGCEFGGQGPFHLILDSGSGLGFGSYKFQAECENVPCGQSDTAVVDAIPNRLGQDHFATALLRGRDLDLLETAKLRLGGSTVQGELQDPAADGRAIEVRFDLADAPAGNWNLEAGFLDGTVRTLASAVRVEAVRPPRISVELVGRDVFRVGRPSTVTVEVANSGNVDGVAVPVVLSGIPAGSTIVPRFQLQAPQGPIESPTTVDSPFDQATETVELEDGIAVPMVVPRVPAGKSLHLEYQITAPLLGTSYTLQATAGQCLGNLVPGTTAVAAGVKTQAFDFASYRSCAWEVGSGIAGLVKEQATDCISTSAEVSGVLARGITLPLFGIRGAKVISWSNVLDFGMSGTGCFLPAAKKAKIVGKTTERIIKGAGTAADVTGVVGECAIPASRAFLSQQVVAAFDPNELIGPAGVGAQHYIPGNQPLAYQILFENKADATAPAQRVETTVQLDTTKFDPATVLFQGVRFGDTELRLPYPDTTIDDVIDLRPAQDLQVEVDASVTPGGLIRFTLQAIDPDTLAAPEDPLAGFLPPNAVAPEGEGALLFSAGPRQLPSGTVLSNLASIVFDANPAIVTPTWSNVIDRSPPTPSIAASTDPSPLGAAVSWGGSDDASGIDLWKIEVSRDGGPFELWRTANAPATATYLAPAAGSYSFRAIAYDGAGNSGQSAAAGIAIDAPLESPPSGGAMPSGASPAPPIPTVGKATKKPVRCQKGFKKKRVRGKTRCVRKGAKPRRNRAAAASIGF